MAFFNRSTTIVLFHTLYGDNERCVDMSEYDWIFMKYCALPLCSNLHKGQI